MYSVKPLIVKLDRLSKEEIQRIIGNIEGGSRKTMEFNFSLKLDRNKQWKCVENFSKFPVTTSNDNIVKLRLAESNIERPKLSNIRRKNTCGIFPSEMQPSIKRKRIDESENVASSRQSERLATNRHESVTSKKIVQLEYPRVQVIEPSANNNNGKNISELSVNTQKRKVWSDCKKFVDRSKLVEGAVVFAKQAGYSPWPGRIVSMTKSRSSAVVEYLGYGKYTGSVKFDELVQLDDNSKDAIGILIFFTLNARCIREFERFHRAIIELKLVMGENKHFPC